MKTPYGEWESPVESADVAAAGVDLGHLALADGVAYWLERRPSEDGRGAVVRDAGDGASDVTPADHDVRTLVHEYGGGDFAVAGDRLYYSRFEDQRLYRVALDAADPAATAEPLTPAPETERGLRYADVAVAPGGDRLYAVRERHEGHDGDEAVNELVTLPAAGGDPTVVAAGHDFYSFPRVSPAGDRLAWTTWDHPRMPWDGTTLHVADLADDGTVTDERSVLGGPSESVFQPSWGPGGDLYAVSDRSGWWNLYRVDPEDEADPTNCHPADEEFGTPQWTFGLSTYAPLSDGRVATLHGVGDDWALGVLDPETGALTDLETGYDAYPHPRLVSDGEGLLTVAAGPAEPESVVHVHAADLADVAPSAAATEVTPTVRRQSVEVALDERYVSRPESVTFDTGDGEAAHAIYYPPHSPDHEGPADEAPPLVTKVHGGPTSQTHPAFDLGIQFFTTRGVGVVDVNYRGSTGYGRAYRERLNGEWGAVDTEDCVNAARHLAGAGRADPDRLAIRGGSAGGYATLCALAFHDAFDAGTSYYGVADLRALAEHTHKFESRYLDSMVGPLPEAEATYRERSPVEHADGIGVPLLLLQGSEDAVVPPEQADLMVEALRANDVPHAHVEFEGERHGFRREETRRRALELEFSFYGDVFGFEPADELERVELAGDDAESGDGESA